MDLEHECVLITLRTTLGMQLCVEHLHGIHIQTSVSTYLPVKIRIVMSDRPITDKRN